MSKKHHDLGTPIPLEITERYYQFNRQYAVRDIFDGLVELITNSDDSYHRLFSSGYRDQDGGQILIECQEQRKGQSSIIRVRDRAEGMTLTEMIDKLGNVGTRRSQEGDRGFMARGAKDCTELGAMTIESIKEERYYRCYLTQRPELIPMSDGDKVTGEIRSSLGIKRGNGTVVTLTLEARHKLPRLNTLIRDLPWHFALRDIMDENSATQVTIRNLNESSRSSEHAAYRRPHGELAVDEVFEVPQYPGMFAHLSIWRSPEPFEMTGDRRFRRVGLLVKGRRAIHDCSLLIPEFERDPYAARYFGRLECDGIDDLLSEYDDCRARGGSFPEYNPRLLIDPNRQQGLVGEHPFTQNLYQVPTERLRALIAKDRELEHKQHSEIANREMQKRLDRLARIASHFLREQIEDISESVPSDGANPTPFYEQGVMIAPMYVRLAVGEEKTLWMYVRRGPTTSEYLDASASTVPATPAVTVLDSVFQLTPHPTKDDRLRGTFRIRGETPTSPVYIEAVVSGLPSAKVSVEVLEAGVDKRDFIDPLEFQHSRYRVREAGTRTLCLYAQFPDLVSVETPVRVWSDNDGVVVRGNHALVPVAGSNYARADVTIEGRRLNANAAIWGEVNGRLAVTNAEVIEKDTNGIPLRFELRDEDFGNFRARWADSESQPNLLLISARHKSVKRYLGPGPDFEGQNSPAFRLLLAEIISESVCRKLLILEAQHRSWEFGLANLKEDRAIVDDVLARLHRRIRDFVADAHEVMLSDGELASLS